MDMSKIITWGLFNNLFSSMWIMIVVYYRPYGVCSLYKENICDVFSPECGPNEVILMKKALYGRMKEGICRTANLGYLGCSEDVLNIVDTKCSARESCSLVVHYNTFKSDPCPQLANYLEVEYECLRVVTSGFPNCQTCQGIEIITETGYLSSEIASKTSCGSSRCPWLLKAKEGQTIEITLFDFSDKSLGSSTDNCYLHAVIMKGDNQRSIQVCGTSARTSKTHFSQSNQLKMYLVHENRSPFLIQYKFIGCQDITNEHMIIHRQGNKAKIKCKNSNHEHEIKCEVDNWKGLESITCSDYKQSSYQDFSSVSWDLWAILISSVCFMLGCFIIVFGLWSFCREKLQGDNRIPVKVYEDIYNEPLPYKANERSYQQHHPLDHVFSKNQDFPSNYDNNF